jgi:hypothetical protein
VKQAGSAVPSMKIFSLFSTSLACCLLSVLTCVFDPFLLPGLDLQVRWWIFRPVSILHTWQHHWHRHTVASMIVSVRSISGFLSQNASTSIGASLR